MLLKLITVEKKLCFAGMAVAGFLLASLVLLSGVNVACRLAGHPISASYELSGLFGALIAALALADTQRKRGHVELDLQVDHPAAEVREDSLIDRRRGRDGGSVLFSSRLSSRSGFRRITDVSCSRPCRFVTSF